MNALGAGSAATSGRGNYLDALNLRRPPFSLTPEPAFFYAEPALMQRLDLLVHLAQFSDRVLVLTGPNGAGKTSLLQQFMMRASENWRVCAMDSSEIPHRNALFARLASCFGAAGKGKSTEVDITALLDRWSALQSSGFLPMLVIDDAHKLNGGTIEALLNLAGDPTRTAERVRLILAGEPGLVEQRLSLAGLQAERDHLVHIIALPPLTAEQTAAYLTYRLAVAGYSGESPFPPSEAHVIHKTAGGLPGRVNRLAHQYLEERMGAAGTPDRARPHVGRWLRRWFLVSCAVAAAAVVLWKQNAINQLFNPSATTRQKIVARKPPAAPKGNAEGRNHTAVRAPTPPAARSAASSPPAGGTPAALLGGHPAMITPSILFAEHPTPATPATKGETPITTRPSTPHLTSAERGAASPLATTPAPSATSSLPTQPTLSAASAGAATPITANSKRAHGSATVVKPATAQRAKPAKSPGKEVTSIPPIGPVLSTWLLQQSPSGYAIQMLGARDETSVSRFISAHHLGKQAMYYAKELTSIPPSGPVRATWLLQQNPSAYAIQILGARDETSVSRFISAHHLGKQAMYYAAEFKGSPWYVLLYGVYPNISAAHHALLGLSQKVRSGGPWIRRLSAVQHDIRRYRKTLGAARDNGKGR